MCILTQVVFFFGGLVGLLCPQLFYLVSSMVPGGDSLVLLTAAHCCQDAPHRLLAAANCLLAAACWLLMLMFAACWCWLLNANCRLLVADGCHLRWLLHVGGWILMAAGC